MAETLDRIADELTDLAEYDTDDSPSERVERVAEALRALAHADECCVCGLPSPDGFDHEGCHERASD